MFGVHRDRVHRAHGQRHACSDDKRCWTCSGRLVLVVSLMDVGGGSTHSSEGSKTCSCVQSDSDSGTDYCRVRVRTRIEQKSIMNMNEQAQAHERIRPTLQGVRLSVVPAPLPTPVPLLTCPSCPSPSLTFSARADVRGRYGCIRLAGSDRAALSYQPSLRLSPKRHFVCPAAPCSALESGGAQACPGAWKETTGRHLGTMGRFCLQGYILALANHA